jgi:chitin disaccharide deacetylase
MKTSLNAIIALVFLLAPASLIGQQHKSTTELLGYPADSKLLILHADDLGLSHSTNMAVIKAFENNAVSSASIMVPCPWFPEIADYVKSHPGLDVGIHFTLNAEWKFYRWSGISSPTEIPGLLDKDGYFNSSLQPLIFGARPEEVEKELRAQINRAIAFGIKPTHIDSHMGSMFISPALFRVAVKVAEEYKIPLFVPMNEVKKSVPFLIGEIPANLITVDNFQMLPGEAVKGDWKTMYANFIKAIVPGLNEIVVHLSIDDEEMQGIARDHEDYGSAWRQKDLDLVTSEEFKKLLRDNHIQLVTWRQVQKAMYPENGNQ